MDVSSLSRSLLTIARMSVSTTPPEELSLGSYTHMMNSELYPHKVKVVDDGCPDDIEPFHLLSGESIEFLGRSVDSYIVISNYRFFASLEKGFYNVPLGLIESADVQNARDELVVLCRDGRFFKFVFDSPQKCKLWQERLSDAAKQSRSLKSVFALVHWAYHKDKKIETEVPEEDLRSDPGLLSIQASKLQDCVTAEYKRLGMDLTTSWRITECNSKYKMCSTYPKLFVVPKYITDTELMEVAKFRMSGRIPVVVWRHPTNGSVIARSSQPLVGMLNWRNDKDEKLLMAVSEACAETRHHPLANGDPCPNGGPLPQVMKDRGSELLNGRTGVAPLQNGHIPPGDVSIPDLLVLDLRSYTAVLGNRAKGGGCEHPEYYTNCEVQFKGLPNIHSVRKSFQQLRNILRSEDQSSFLSNLEGCQWLNYLCQLLSVAGEVVSVVHKKGQPVLVHCSDGWDRTAQVVALAELLLDSYYRTVEGFQVLVEREWLAYGHKFGDRCGHMSDDSNQRSPVFLQWLDCVHQLMRQFPCDFEFNEAFLIKLGHHCYSGLFGTFLGNSVKEREEGRVVEETFSVWSYLCPGHADFTNYLYFRRYNKVLHPVAHIRNMLLWKGMYCSPVLTPYQEERVSPCITPRPSSTRTGHTIIERMSASNPEKEATPLSGRDPGPFKSPTHSTEEDALSNGSELSPTTASELSPTTASDFDSDNQEKGNLYHGFMDNCLTGSPTTANTKTDVLATKLLQDAILDESDRLLHDLTGSGNTLCNSTLSTPLNLGADGLPRVYDTVHTRLKELECRHDVAVSELQKRLEEARQAVKKQRRELEEEEAGPDERGGSPHEDLVSPEAQPPSSLNSWDCVDTKDEQGVRWVPDHAAIDCQGCGNRFSIIVRKHHCRNCGGVFCGTCTNYFCPVPIEQLYDDVRVCEKCFNKLDGHLVSKDQAPPGPT